MGATCLCQTRRRLPTGWLAAGPPRTHIRVQELACWGTFFPFLRASERPMAIACLRLLTFFPLRPLRSVPFFRLRIARSTSLDALREYRRAMEHLLDCALAPLCQQIVSNASHAFASGNNVTPASVVPAQCPCRGAEKAPRSLWTSLGQSLTSTDGGRRHRRRTGSTPNDRGSSGPFHETQSRICLAQTTFASPSKPRSDPPELVSASQLSASCAREDLRLSSKAVEDLETIPRFGNDSEHAMPYEFVKV